MSDGMSVGGFNPGKPISPTPEIKIVSTNRCYVPDCPSPIIDAITFNRGLPSREVGGTHQFRHRWHGGTSNSMRREYGYITDLFEACNFVSRQLRDDPNNYTYWTKAKRELQRILLRGCNG